MTMVHGRVRRRTDQSGAQIFVMDTVCAVRSGQSTPEVHARLRRGIATMHPERTVIPTNGSAFAFDIVSDWFDLSARYIIGLAALITGDVSYAESLLVAVEKALPTRGQRHPSLLAIRKNLPEHLSTL